MTCVRTTAGVRKATRLRETAFVGRAAHLIRTGFARRNADVDVHAEAALGADPQRSGHEDVDVVGEGGGVFDTVQVGGRGPANDHPGR
ncbi:hypothetical protein [Micromonospora profundi]|uniref:hypothetical protein n=1 Tax=Micromonospora profundi TaxID=1420889 RepID=UPI00364E15AE